MTQATVLVLAALAASILLFLQVRPRLLPIIALAASGVEAVIAFNVIRLDLKGVPLALILGAALAASGALLFLRVSNKRLVAAATTVTLVGGLQVLAALL